MPFSSFFNPKIITYMWFALKMTWFYMKKHQNLKTIVRLNPFHVEWYKPYMGDTPLFHHLFFVKKKLFSLNWLCLLGGCNSDLIFLDLGLHRKQQTTSLNPRQWTSRTPPPLPPKKTQKNDMEYLLIKFLFVWENRK